MTTARSQAPAFCLRPLERGDRSSLLEILSGMGPRSRQRRFLTPKPRLTEGELRRLTEVDQRDHVAIVAVSARTGRPVGIGRFIRENDRTDSADVAMAVVDAWQNRGVGALLARALSRRAREVGVRRFTLLTQRDNRAVLRLLDGGPGDIARLDDDPAILELAISLPD